jgi:hypothetical protein
MLLPAENAPLAGDVVILLADSGAFLG